MITLLIYQYLATLIIYAQLMEKWDIWYIYEGVSIFGLSSRCTNLMDPEIEFVQLILSPLHMTYTVHTYIDKYIPVTFAVNACLACLLTLNTWSTDILVHVCVLQHATWILHTRWVAFWQLWIWMSRSRSMDLGEVLVAAQNGTVEAWRFYSSPPDLSLLVGSWDSSFLL